MATKCDRPVFFGWKRLFLLQKQAEPHSCGPATAGLGRRNGPDFDANK